MASDVPKVEILDAAVAPLSSESGSMPHELWVLEIRMCEQAYFTSIPSSLRGTQKQAKTINSAGAAPAIEFANGRGVIILTYRGDGIKSHGSPWMLYNTTFPVPSPGFCLSVFLFFSFPLCVRRSCGGENRAEGRTFIRKKKQG